MRLRVAWAHQVSSARLRLVENRYAYTNDKIAWPCTSDRENGIHEFVHLYESNSLDARRKISGAVIEFSSNLRFCPIRWIALYNCAISEINKTCEGIRLLLKIDWIVSSRRVRCAKPRPTELIIEFATLSAYIRTPTPNRGRSSILTEFRTFFWIFKLIII